MNLTDLFLNGIDAYGPVVLALALLIAALGLPTPATPLILAAGAFARQGLIDGPTAFALALSGVVLGDVGSYTIGRLAGGKIKDTGRQGQLLSKAQERLSRHGSLAIFLTRNVFVSLDVPTSLIAGSGRYTFQHFLLLALAGRFTWLLFYAGLGYVFSSQWQTISQLAGQYSMWLGGLALVSITIYYLLRRLSQGIKSSSRDQSLTEI